MQMRIGELQRQVNEKDAQICMLRASESETTVVKFGIVNEMTRDSEGASVYRP
jgi:hypothetical protein